MRYPGAPLRTRLCVCLRVRVWTWREVSRACKAASCWAGRCLFSSYRRRVSKSAARGETGVSMRTSRPHQLCLDRSVGLTAWMAPKKGTPRARWGAQCSSGECEGESVGGGEKRGESRGADGTADGGADGGRWMVGTDRRIGRGWGMRMGPWPVRGHPSARRAHPPSGGTRCPPYLPPAAAAVRGPRPPVCARGRGLGRVLYHMHRPVLNAHMWQHEKSMTDGLSPPPYLP
jgi:hypothetical protein